MKRIQAALLATPLLILSQISSADWVKDAVIKTEPQTIQLRHQIHQHPEPFCDEPPLYPTAE